MYATNGHALDWSNGLSYEDHPGKDRPPLRLPGSENESSPARREQLLNAAVEVFLEHGFFEASLAQICAAAKMSKGSLYHHYASKEDLAVAACVDALRSLHLQLYVTFRDAPRPGIEKLVGGYLDWFERHPRQGTFLLRAPQWNPLAPIADPIRIEEERSLESTRRWFAGLIRQRVFRRLPPAVYEPLVLGPSREFARQWLSRPKVSDLRKARPTFIEAAWSAIAR